jgi:SAM-dependent methyltransferase
MPDDLTDIAIQRQVKQFYDSVGWMLISDELYQNARYEDLRPVSREYIQRCHRRVKRHLPESGRYLLDAGSGPIQYPEYLEYSDGFAYRVCLDLSIRALKEARKRLAIHGLYVVGDISSLPFPAKVFDGAVSLHTIHHLPLSRHRKAFFEIFEVLMAGGKAVVVTSWGSRSTLMRLFRFPTHVAFAAIRLLRSALRREVSEALSIQETNQEAADLLARPGTFTQKHGYGWLARQLQQLPHLQILVWRSVNASFLRAFIHDRLLGRLWLAFLYRIEEWFPRFMGRIGQYPLVIFAKPADDSAQNKGSV